MSRAVQLVLLSAVILTCLQTGAAHEISDGDVERISAAVLQQLLPYINRIEANIRRDLTNLINEKVTSLRESVREDLMDYKNQTASDLQSLQSNTQQLCAKMDILDLKMVSVNVSMREELRAMESQLEEQIVSELAELQSSMRSYMHSSLQSNTQQLSTKIDTLQVSANASMREEFKDIKSQLEEHKQQTASELAGLHTSLQSNTQQLTQLSTKMDNLSLILDSVNASTREELRAMESQLEEYNQQTTSELAGLQSTMSDLHTFLQSNTHQLTQLSVKMNTLTMQLASVNGVINRISDNVETHDNHVTTELMELDQNLQQNFTLQLENSFGYIYPVYTCGGTGGWRRAVYLNFTDPNTPCPSGWQLTSHSKRTCGRATGGYTCDSVTFPVSGGDYTRVCGRIIGYQYRFTAAFQPFAAGRVTSIDSYYVAGISLTHGSPRQHIWTFAAGGSEVQVIYIGNCPCDTTINITIPPFVGGDYFCESGRQPGDPSRLFYSDDPLWDGDGCTASSTCCSFNNPPYFTKQLPSPTTDDIEARLCRDRYSADSDTPIEFIELYVQ